MVEWIVPKMKTLLGVLLALCLLQITLAETKREKNKNQDEETGIEEGIFKFFPFDSEIMNFNRIFGFTQVTKWWQGENVCVEREKITDSQKEAASGYQLFFLSSTMQACREYSNKYECVSKKTNNGRTQTTIERHHCCLGFQRINGGNCEKVDLLSLNDTILKFNASEFLAILERNGQDLSKGNFTIFLPSDDAILEFFREAVQYNYLDLQVNSSRRRRDTKNSDFLSELNLAKAHMTTGFQELASDDAFDSLVNNSTLQIKQLYDGINGYQYLVNCVNVTSPNNYALNGVVHRIEKFLYPPVLTIYEMISMKPEFSILKSILDRSGLASSLNSNEMWTLFAPTDEAFNNLSPHMLNNLKKGNSCAVNLLKNHLLGSTLCAANVELKSQEERSALGEKLKFSMPENNAESNIVNSVVSHFRVNNANVVKKDIIATNGIIHVVDEVMVPDGAMPVTKLLEKRGAHKFVNLIARAGLEYEVDSLSNATFFIPTDKAIQEFMDKTKKEQEKDKTELEILAEEIKPKEFMSNNTIEEIREFVMRHIIVGAIEGHSFKNNEMITTLAKDEKLRINLYSSTTLAVLSNVYNRATVNCAVLLHFDVPQCNNVVHLIDKPLQKVEGNVLDRILEDPNLTTLVKVLNGTDIETVLKSRDNITFIAPTNSAFETLQKRDYDLLLVNKDVANLVLTNHLIKSVMCRRGVRDASWPFNSPWGSHVTSFDHLATNGVVHHTNTLLIPTKLTSGGGKYPNVDVLLSGVLGDF